ncbi:MAG: hypothetical protein ACK452_11590 [Bacteroidota bacterium]
MKKYKFFMLLFGILNVVGQNKYSIDLSDCKKDQIKVEFQVGSQLKKDTIRFCFPATVPGTYATQDYGRFVVSLIALDNSGKKLKVKKLGNNIWQIFSAKKMKSIEYFVEDILDKKVKKNPVFQPASTNFDRGKNFVFNNGGIFGFIEENESEAIQIEIKKPKELFGATSLQTISQSETNQVFIARNYHQLVDCPIMFSPPDTAQFFVNSTKVTISVYDVQGKPRAKNFYKALKRDMEAIAKTLPNLPVDNYTFLIYVDDLREFGKVLSGAKVGLLKKIKLALKFRNLGLGALEHGNSSLYYLGDFGDNVKMEEVSLEGQLTAAAIHEFMHIITPLGLHSQFIGEFNYNNPKMSKHLWLYEGVTEYFAHYVKYKGGVYSEKEFLKAMSEKFANGSSFPVSEMSFTEMSANVLEKKYHLQYDQVYQRGAALAMLLDAEIRKLSNNQKTLLDVIVQLNTKYGVSKSFDEEGFFDEFSNLINPEMRNFFSTYIEGKNQWKPNDQLGSMGIIYYDSLLVNAALSPLIEGENDVKFKRINGGLVSKVEAVGSSEWAGLKIGDLIEYADYKNVFTNDLKDGEIIKLPVKRNGEKINLEVKIRFGPKIKRHILTMTN